MSERPSKSRRKYEPMFVHVKPENRAFLDRDGAARYPREFFRQRQRHLSPAIRDVLDFIEAHYSLFLTWIATRG